MMRRSSSESPADRRCFLSVRAPAVTSSWMVWMMLGSMACAGSAAAAPPAVGGADALARAPLFTRADAWFALGTVVAVAGAAREDWAARDEALESRNRGSNRLADAAQHFGN